MFEKAPTIPCPRFLQHRSPERNQQGLPVCRCGDQRHEIQLHPLGGWFWSLWCPRQPDQRRARQPLDHRLDSGQQQRRSGWIGTGTASAVQADQEDGFELRWGEQDV